LFLPPSSRIILPVTKDRANRKVQADITFSRAMVAACPLTSENLGLACDLQVVHQSAEGRQQLSWTGGGQGHWRGRWEGQENKKRNGYLDKWLVLGAESVLHVSPQGSEPRFDRSTCTRQVPWAGESLLNSLTALRELSEAQLAEDVRARD